MKSVVVGGGRGVAFETSVILLVTQRFVIAH